MIILISDGSVYLGEDEIEISSIEDYLFKKVYFIKDQELPKLVYLKNTRFLKVR